jgi:hypothetical protein
MRSKTRCYQPAMPPIHCCVGFFAAPSRQLAPICKSTAAWVHTPKGSILRTQRRSPADSRMLHFSKSKICFQSFFMLITTQWFFVASVISASAERPPVYSLSTHSNHVAYQVSGPMVARISVTTLEWFPGFRWAFEPDCHAYEAPATGSLARDIAITRDTLTTNSSPTFTRLRFCGFLTLTFWTEPSGAFRVTVLFA